MRQELRFNQTCWRVAPASRCWRWRFFSRDLQRDLGPPATAAFRCTWRLDEKCV